MQHYILIFLIILIIFTTYSYISTQIFSETFSEEKIINKMKKYNVILEEHVKT